MVEIKRDNNVILNISDTDLKILENDLLNVYEEIDRRINWVISHKSDECYKRFRSKWETVLISEGAKSIPAQRVDFVDLITSRPDYKNRAQREAKGE